MVQCTDAERGWLAEYLTFAGKRVGRQEPKRLCLFNAFSSSYPSGFDALVRKAAVADGIHIDWLDTRTPPCVIDTAADLAWLRDYQREAVDVAAERTRGILWLPTGAGKTEIMVGLVRALPCRWLALVHRSQLADDIASRFERRSPGLTAGRVLGGRFEIPKDAMLVAATYQSINAALEAGGARARAATDLLTRAQGLLADECHVAPATTFNAVLMRTVNAHYRVGLSGTPLARGDARSQFAIAALGPIIKRIKPQLLIDQGVLANPTVRMVALKQESARKMWGAAYKELITKSTARNALVVKLAQRATKPAFVFVEQTEHGKTLTNLLMRAGVRAEFVWGSHSLTSRKSLIKRLELGHFDALVCSRVFNEGIDVPSLRSVVNAGGMKSVIATLQRLGRGMRVDRDLAGNVREGGGVFEVWDVLDKGNTWMQEHARIRRDAYLAEGYELFVEDQ